MATQARAELLNGFASAARRLDAIDFAVRAPKVGDQAPDLALPDQHGEEVYLSALLRDGSVVLVSYRRQRCPYRNLQLRPFQADLDQIAERGAQLLAISPQTPDHSLSLAEKNALRFLLLPDVGANVIDPFGLKYDADPEDPRAVQVSRKRTRRPQRSRRLRPPRGRDVRGRHGPRRTLPQRPRQLDRARRTSRSGFTRYRLGTGIAKLPAMQRFVLSHRHDATECPVAAASWKGFRSPLRKSRPVSPCATGRHRMWWAVEAPDRSAALAQLPPFVAPRTFADEVREVRIP
jgi:peroxiredoxin